MRFRAMRARGFVLAGALVLSSAGGADAVLVDAVLGQVGSAAVTASDIALARALALFGFTPSAAPIDAADVDRYATALVNVLEATRLGLGPTEAEIEQGWRALEDRQGGAAALQSWLGAMAIDRAWARRGLEAHLRWRMWEEFNAGLATESARSPAPDPGLTIRRFLRRSDTEPLPFAMPPASAPPRGS